MSVAGQKRKIDDEEFIRLHDIEKKLRTAECEPEYRQIKPRKSFVLGTVCYRM